MQTRKNSMPEVIKPVLTGSWHGRDAVRQGFHMMLSILLVTFAYMLISLLFGFDSIVLRIISGLFLVAGAFASQYGAGAGAGQKDAAFAEIMYQRRQEGREIDREELDRCFHPAKGFFAATFGAMPYVLLALVFACLTQPQTYSLGVLPNWLKTYARQSGLGDALNYYQTQNGLPLLTVLRMIVRGMTMPFINIAVKLGVNATLWAERLTPIWVLIAPLGYGFGYAQGLKMRAKINTGIAIGDQKKKRRERKEHRARESKRAPERLV